MPSSVRGLAPQAGALLDQHAGDALAAVAGPAPDVGVLDVRPSMEEQPRDVHVAPGAGVGDQGTPPGFFWLTSAPRSMKPATRSGVAYL